MPNKTGHTSSPFSLIPESQANISSAKGFKKVYEHFFEKLFGICFHLIRDEGLANDMVHDIFLSLWKNRKQLQIKVSLERYLVRAAKLKALDHIRTRVRKGKTIAFTGMEEKQFHNSTEETLQLNELQGTVNTLLHQLPVNRKKIFQLSRDMGMSNKEIAQHFNITEKGVEYHMSKALAFLRQNLIVS